MIEVAHLTKSYGAVKAVDDLTFRVEQGEIMGFLGPNGAGKTTTMRMLTGYMPPTAGSATVAGYDVYKHSLEVRRRIGYLPENLPLYPEMTVESYLLFVARIKGVVAHRRKAQVVEAMEKCSVVEMRQRIIGHLSKGYKQRVGLAQALLNDPQVLILDEPTIGLDPKQISEVRELIRSLRGEHTVILSTHILPEVSMTCTRVAIIDRGRLVAVDSPQNLTAQSAGAERVYLEVAGPADKVEQAVMGLPGVLRTQINAVTAGKVQMEVESQPEQDIRSELAALVVNQSWKLLELRTVTLSLEDIFIKLTTSEERVLTTDMPPA
ncbi:MAG: ATP-binding cassette domain-containing protein [Acidobacteria bacterium]|nr:ATP-binding cassette domain-containing protein [Acidobacteriota bacterium]MBI3654879.1 ATP-binding cassette domain-containing protein [Acidobacteriota bacterium]